MFVMLNLLFCLLIAITIGANISDEFIRKHFDKLPHDEIPYNLMVIHGILVIWYIVYQVVDSIAWIVWTLYCMAWSL
jgi:hypothetical protein